MLNDDENAYTVLAMLLEPVISEEFRIMKKGRKESLCNLWFRD